jgi:hypothetical protein
MKHIISPFSCQTCHMTINYILKNYLFWLLALGIYLMYFYY